MNKGELTDKTGDNNEDKNSKDVKNQTVIEEIETKLSNKGLEQIIVNIGSQSSAVEMPKEIDDDNDNPADNDSEVLDTNNVKPTADAPSPNDSSESHDEDLLLRWEDDDETTNQEKIYDNIPYDLDSLDNSFGIDKTEICAAVKDDDKSNKVENIPEDIMEDDSIDFLKQQLKVLSESINPNLNTHAIDVPNLLGNEFATPNTSKSLIGTLDGFGETVASKESASSVTEIAASSHQDVDSNEMVATENLKADYSKDENLKVDVQDESNINKANDVEGDVETGNNEDAEQIISDGENSVEFDDAVDDFVKDAKSETSQMEGLESNEASCIEKTETETEDSINNVTIEKTVEEMENPSEITTVALTENITEDTISKPLDVEVVIDNVADAANVDDNLTIKEDTNYTELTKSYLNIEGDSSKAIDNIKIIEEENIEETSASITPEDTSKITIDNSTDTKVEDDIKELKSVEGDNQKRVETEVASEIRNNITNKDTDKNIEESKKNLVVEEMVVDITEAIDTKASDDKLDKCESYIDLSSQSPISLDETSDTENPSDTKIDEKKSKNENKSSNEDSNYYNVKSDHRLRPDVMIEIPTQNLLDVDMDESIDIDSEDTSQEAETKTQETKDKEEKSVDDKKEDQKQLVESKKLPQDEGKIDLDVIDVDLDDDSNEEISTDNKIDNDDNLNVSKEVSIDSKVENKMTEPKDISNIKEQTKETKPEIAENVIDLDDDEVSEVNNIVDSDKSNVKIEESMKDDVQPSTSSECVRSMTPDASDEVAEVSDNLGLLAESSRVRRDEPEEEFDEDDDYDQDDESSNQMTADHSEDSNAQHSEPDSKDQGEKTPEVEARPFNFTVAEVADSKEKELQEAVVEEQVEKPVILSCKSMAEELSTTDKNLEEIGPNEQDLAKSADIETVKLSDNSDNEAEQEKAKEDENTQAKTPEKTEPSPSKTKKLEISKPRHVLNIVDLEESSSEEDVQEEPKSQEEQVEETEGKDPEVPSDFTSVNIPTEIEIMSTSCGNTSEIVTKEGEVVISGVPRPPPHKPARLNTSEVTIKTAPASMESTLIIPETKMSDSIETKPKVGLEIFNLDSDDEDIGSSGEVGGARLSALELDAALRAGRCMRRGCGAGARGGGALAHYCTRCAATHYRRTQELVEGIKNMTPLLDLNMEKFSQDLVEISDSDSEPESKEAKVTIGKDGAKMLHENLANIMNGIWKKYKMDASLGDAKAFLDVEMERLESETKEINKMLNDCQTATDKLRSELYATFEPQRIELPAVNVVESSEFATLIAENRLEGPVLLDLLKHGKRRLSATNPTPAKKPAIPLSYTPIDQDSVQKEYSTMLRSGGVFIKAEEDKEISVVQLSAEAAPPDLPGAGEARRAALRPGMQVYAMRNAFGAWTKARILDQVKIVGPQTQFPSFRVRFENKVKNPCKVLSARCLAYHDASDVRLTIGTRVIALFRESANVNKRESYYSGIIAEIPNPVNMYRYLVFFDDGYAQYAAHGDTRVVCACAAPVWEEVHPFSREFVRNYLCAYPERPMVRLHAGQKLNTEWNGKWWDSTVVQVDASLVQVHFQEDDRTEWIYRGSTRLEPLFLELQAAGKARGRHVPRTKAQISVNMPYVEYTRSYEQDKSTIDAQQEELRRQRAVAKKSTTTTTTPGVQEPPDPYASRVVYYTPRNAVRPYKMVPHTCGPKCKRSDVLTLKELKSYNPLAKPLLSGWERQLVRHKSGSWVVYRAPCGRRLRGPAELHRYLRATRHDMPVDLFDFHPGTHCLAEFVLTKCVVGKKDLSHGKENVPVPCVNNVDDSLPEFCSYNTERTPTAGVPLNLDPEFLCGCDCTDDCEDKTKCACWKLTLEGAKTIGLEGPNVGYDYKRLPEPLPSGIYECNVRCKCKHTCLNRVAQHPLQLKLQVFKTPNRGWGIRALNDVPKGAFLCVYAGNLLTDATANLDGLNEGDEYLAELDYIEVVEQMKEGYEDDVPEADKVLDQKESEKKEEKSSEEESSSSEDEEEVSKNEEEDDDFLPGYIGPGVMEFNKRLRKRGKDKKEVKDEPKEEQEKEKDKDGNGDEECITISDDEEVREPSRFAAQAEMGANEHVPKYRSVRSYFGKDEACYIMDAKVQGNIGRYLNHSCAPNVFVQNVFVDTHDPRFPWVAFFALTHIRAGTELTWNYNYDVGSVPGKVLYCYCGAPNCRRRLL